MPLRLQASKHTAMMSLWIFGTVLHRMSSTPFSHHRTLRQKSSSFRSSATRMPVSISTVRAKWLRPSVRSLLKHLISGSLIGLDKSCALEHVKVGDIETDYGKLVDRQLEQISITSINGFAKIIKDASKVLNVATSSSGT